MARRIFGKLICGVRLTTAWKCSNIRLQMMIFKNQSGKGAPWSFISSTQDMTCEHSEDMLNVNVTKSMLDNCPNDDMWRKFALPLTPPSSPPRTYGESSESEESSDDCCDIADRLQDVSDNLDSTIDAEDYRNFYRLTEAINIRSKLISDCMWSGDEVRRLSFSSSQNISTTPEKLSIKQLSVEIIHEDLFPTPCPSPPANVTSTDCLSSSECVDPTTVFPFPITSSESSSGQSSDSDEEEIDVVTIDTKPLKINLPHHIKRKPRSSLQPRSSLLNTRPLNTSSPTPTLPKTVTPPIIRRVVTEPPIPPIQIQLEKSSRKREREATSPNFYRDGRDGDSSDPDRRATHNVLERRRRIDLKKSFERLRECVPNLENKEKSPKVVVLRRAANYIDLLTKQGLDLEEQKITLQSQKRVLVDKLKKLTRHYRS